VKGYKTTDFQLQQMFSVVINQEQEAYMPLYDQIYDISRKAPYTSSFGRKQVVHLQAHSSGYKSVY
jgi:hypothetical protein